MQQPIKLKEIFDIIEHCEKQVGKEKEELVNRIVKDGSREQDKGSLGIR